MSASMWIRQWLEERPQSVWQYLTPARLACWLTCPWRFKLRYLDGVRPRVSPEEFLDRLLRRLLGEFYRQRQMGTEGDVADLLRRFDGWWPQAVGQAGMDFASVTEEQFLQRQAMERIVGYLAQAADEDARVLQVEFAAEAALIDPETGEDWGFPLVGILDLVLDAGQGPTLVDFRTASRNGDALEILEEIPLACQAYLWRQASGRAEAGLEIRTLVKTSLPLLQTHRYAPRTPHHLRRLFAAMRAYGEALAAGRFVFRPGPDCATCEFRQTHCHHWPN